jgi:Reverse transcriptase (RNA-dependent DNA polymerase)
MGLCQKGRWTFQTKMCCKGFSQIPVKDFQENHTAGVSDTTLHLLLDINTAFKLSSRQFNIETTFLHGELGEDLWMAIPDGYPEYMKNSTYLLTQRHSV